MEMISAMYKPKKKFMQLAIAEAKRARDRGDYAIGAVITRLIGNREVVIASAGNRVKTSGSFLYCSCDKSARRKEKRQDAHRGGPQPGDESRRTLSFDWASGFYGGWYPGANGALCRASLLRQRASKSAACCPPGYVAQSSDVAQD
jgi:hypothetical protein